MRILRPLSIDVALIDALLQDTPLETMLFQLFFQGRDDKIVNLQLRGLFRCHRVFSRLAC